LTTFNQFYWKNQKIFFPYRFIWIITSNFKINTRPTYHFISGYTKVAGTEARSYRPQPNFSACFGAPFMPLHPTKYAEMLSKKIQEADVKVWLINTGWTGGAYGTGSRMKLKYTRAMITAALNGELDAVEYKYHAVLDLLYLKPVLMF
jgi:phosphoenolpyruvate carboxykinase (ATP)